MKSRESITIKSDEVHIWSTCLLDSEKYTNYFSAILSEDESERANNYRFCRDKENFIIARGILRCLLGAYLGKTPQSLEIIYGIWGKPCLTNKKVVHFNLSHSGNYALYAVSHSYEVGIDLEYIDKKLDLEGIALNAFSPDELNAWKKARKFESKESAFFKLWVCKEAFLKASGKGWLGNEETMIFRTENVFKKKLNNNILENMEITYPHYIECIPGYASALFVAGPPLQLIERKIIPANFIYF